MGVDDGGWMVEGGWRLLGMHMGLFLQGTSGKVMYDDGTQVFCTLIFEIEH